MCFFPIRLKIRGRFLDVPCGKCRMCLQEKKNELVTKLVLENESNDNISFFGTLTLNPLYYDFFFDSSKFAKYEIKKLVLFLKYHLDDNLRYFITSELGDKSKRLHYHFIIWSKKNPLDLISSFWKKFGFVTCSKLRSVGAIKYTSSYVVAQSGVFRFMSTSPPLGINFLLNLSFSNPIELLKALTYGKIIVNNISLFLPKSYYQFFARNLEKLCHFGLLSPRCFEYIDDFMLESNFRDTEIIGRKFKFPTPSIETFFSDDFVKSKIKRKQLSYNEKLRKSIIDKKISKHIF